MRREQVLSLLKPLLSRAPIYFSRSTGFQMAAILVIIHYNFPRPHVLLTKRSSSLRSHTAEISFPGGKYTADDECLTDTAIRETKEELGLTFNRNDIIGSLDTVKTLTSNYNIVPYITLQDKIPEPMIFVDEVEKVLDVPLFDLLQTMAADTDHYHLTLKEVYKFTSQNEVIWGATARVLKQLYDCFCR